MRPDRLAALDTGNSQQLDTSLLRLLRPSIRSSSATPENKKSSASASALHALREEQLWTQESAAKDKRVQRQLMLRPSWSCKVQGLKENITCRHCLHLVLTAFGLLAQIAPVRHATLPDQHSNELRTVQLLIKKHGLCMPASSRTKSCTLAVG